MKEIGETDSSVGLNLEKIDKGYAWFHVEDPNREDDRCVGCMYEEQDTGERFYVTFRKGGRSTKDGGEAHFQRKEGTYAISNDVITDIVENWNINKVLIFDVEAGDLHIHKLSHYIQTDRTLEYEDLQRAPDVSKAETHEGVARGIDFYPDKINV